MKILMVNKFFYIKGGSETYYFALKEILEQNGHEVIDFSMHDEKNFSSKYSSYFVNNVDYNKNQNFIDKIKLAKNIIYSKEASEKLEKLIQDTKPDIAHLHIFQHQLSPSILDVLKKYNIPIVYTAHDLKMICPNYKMLSNGLICENCKGHRYLNCTKQKCIKSSTVKSAIGTIEAYFHYYKKSYDKIDYIITPSNFYRNKFIEFGVNEDKVIHIPNFLNVEKVEYDSLDNNDYILYFGRLSEEKGILTLIKAMKGINSTLKIVGTGPLEGEITDYLKKENFDNVELLGFKSGKDLNTLIANSKVVVLPSEWYENGPYSGIETLKLSVPIIGSDLGGIPELVDDGENGYIFKHNDIDDLHGKLQKICDLTNNELNLMKNKSREKFEKLYTSDVHYERILEVYNNVLKSKEL